MLDTSILRCLTFLGVVITLARISADLMDLRGVTYGVFRIDIGVRYGR